MNRSGILLTMILIATRSFASAAPADTLRLYYGIGFYELSEANKKLLKIMSDSADIIRPIQIIGFTDQLGTASFNKNLSDKRADEVKNYLRYLGNVAPITAEGKGRILSGLSYTSLGEPANRRVDIIFKRKDRPIPKDTTRSVTVAPPGFKAKLDSLSTTKIGEGVDFDELIFYPGSHHLLYSSMPLLKELRNYLVLHKNITFEIRGHICCDYSRKDGPDLETRTLNLSVNRAKEVYDYLLANGISSERMTYKGVGSTKPKIYPEMSDEDRSANRRVEIIVVSK